MKTGNDEIVRHLYRSIVMVMGLLWVWTEFGIAREAGNICNSKVVDYLKSAGFSFQEVHRICSEAGISVEEYQEESNKCEALARQIELVWEERPTATAMDMKMVKHAVDLVCPKVCNAEIAKYLKSVSIPTQSIREICVLAEKLVEQEALKKEDALKKAMRVKSRAVYQINDQVIRGAVQLLQGEKEGS